MNKWIELSDIQAIRQITSNVDSVQSIEPYIIEAQNINVRNLLGIKFFNVLRKGFETVPMPDKYSDILNGKKYTIDEIEIEFAGMKPLVAYYAFARAIPNLGKRVSRFGVVKKTSNFSEQLEPEELASMVLEAKSIAKVFEDDLLYFLENNKEQYPEFFTCAGSGIKPTINITAVGGRKPSYE